MCTKAIISVTSFFTMNETDKVILKWVTKNESSNQLFEIERSVDGKNFTRLGALNGKGKIDMPTNYAVEDLNPVSGIAYYRLTQKDAAGKINFSETKVVNQGQILTGYVTIYPNPVHGLLTVKLMAAQNETTGLELYDMFGRRIQNQAINLIKGEQNLTVDMSKLVNGSYVLKIN